MDAWITMIVGSDTVVPELMVFCRIVGALFLLEIALTVVSFLSGIGKR